MNSFSFSATLSASFGFRACASPAMGLANPLTFKGWSGTLELCAFGLGLATLAGNTPAECFEVLF
jgi:hypothetical protein